MRFDPETNRVLVRQSWLGDALMCPQRAKYALTMPSMRRGSDATAIGTGLHSAIEQVLREDVFELEHMQANARLFVSKELDKDIKRTDLSSDMDHVNRCVDSMCDAWWNGIRPAVATGGLIEYRFVSPLGVHASNGNEIWLEGTMDYVAPDGVIWDWKTAGRSYYAKEKQTQSHQATCYITAGRTLDLIPDGADPSIFRFGVMFRQDSPKSQIVTVTRGPEQTQWFARQVKSVVDSAIRSWANSDWPMNDQHNLCSSKWCDYWNVCKGAHWTEESLALPSQKVDIPVTADESL
jgi:hypothetical protein